MANGNNIGSNYAFGLNGGNVTTPTISGGDLNIEEQNAVITQWASMVQRRLRGAAVILNHGKEGSIARPGRTERKLEDSIRTQSRKTYGVITGQSFIFERHGAFVHKGVGRGYVIKPKKSGNVVRTARTKDPKTGKQLTWTEREPFEWFNPVLQQSLPELANKLAEINADAVLNATRMMIK